MSEFTLYGAKLGDESFLQNLKTAIANEAFFLAYANILTSISWNGKQLVFKYQLKACPDFSVFYDGYYDVMIGGNRMSIFSHEEVLQMLKDYSI